VRRPDRLAHSVLVAAGARRCALNPEQPSAGPPVLVVPAFYLDAQSFQPFVRELRSRGYNAALPPIR
jgi:hypothetical protein